MKKYYLIIFCFSLLLPSAFSQPMDEKRNQYQFEKIKIEELEKKAQYSGDDEIIRARSNLPPKLPSFEDWLKLKEDNQNSNKNLDKVIIIEKPEILESNNTSQVKEISASGTPVNESIPAVKNASKPANLETSQSCRIITDDKGNSRQSCKLDSIEKTISIGLISIFLILNFILYAHNKKIRFLTISTPFDVFAKESSGELGVQNNYKKYIIEFSLLILFVGLYAGATSEKSTGPGGLTADAGYSPFTLNCILILSFLYFSYLILRFIFGFSSRCPKCKLQFASRTLSSHDEPKSTYEKRRTMTNGAVKIDVWETGITIKEQICFSCSHAWTTTKSYKKCIHKSY
jgi:hypothetical protein